MIRFESNAIEILRREGGHVVVRVADGGHFSEEFWPEQADQIEEKFRAAAAKVLEDMGLPSDGLTVTLEGWL